MRLNVVHRISICAVAALLAGCSGGAGSSPGPFVGSGRGEASSQGLGAVRDLTAALTLPKYGVVIVQENRTVDNLFQTQPGVNTQNFGIDSGGHKIMLTQTSLGVSFDCSHAHSAFVNDVLQGFDTEPCGAKAPTDAAFTYVNPADIVAYTKLASQYGFADNVLQSNEGPSFPAHLYLIAATSETAEGSTFNISKNDGSPAGCNAPITKRVNTIDLSQSWPGSEDNPVFPCISPKTIFNELDDQKIGWRYYTPNVNSIWTAPYAIKSLYTNDKANVIVPETTILSDIMKGKLQPVSYVIPGSGNTDHPGKVNDTGGPTWVASIINTLASSRYKNEYAAIVVWDDWGGFFDHVPDTHKTKLPVFPPNHPNDPYEYGYRVPLLAIGPFAKGPHYVDHTARDFSAIVHFIERVYGLGSLNHLDAQTDDLFSMFNFMGAPRHHVPVPTGNVTIQSLLLRQPDNSPIDSE